MKKRRKHWTTKNTHLKKLKGKKLVSLPTSRLERILYVIGIILAVLSLLIQALNNNIVGYDNFIGIPMEWIKRLN